MNNGPSKDPYTHAVMQRISPGIRASFSPAQMSAIEEAIRGGRIKKEHPIHVRLSLPLLFARYYLVVLIGRDRRLGTQRAEAKRKHTLSVSGVLLFLFLTVSPVLVIIMLILYALKTTLGIDLVPEWHLKDLLWFW